MQLLQPEREGEASPTEEALVRRASAGDAEAFADLYERHLGRVFRYFYYRVGHHQEAEDLTEQVFLKAWQAMAGYHCRGVPFSAWLFRLAHNLLIDRSRSRRDAEPLDDTLEIEDRADGPEQVAVSRAEVAELTQALGQLSTVEQSVVVLRLVEGLDHRSVAGIIGKSEVATRSIQSRALARLAQLLKGLERR